ncbi:VTT domain-containing protein [Candidatus Pacearchaeota archaeon]|nr:VTT domain-containing protein [Candidatus Pacearchaeota archaeon]
MAEKEFIVEVSNKQKIEVFFVSVMILTVFVGIFFAFFLFFKEGIATSSFFQTLNAFFEKDIKNATPLGLFYMSFVGNLLFIPLPFEIPFFIGLTKGNDFLLSSFLVIAGLIPSLAIDYILGKKISRIVFTFISTKKIYKAKRWVNKFGVYAIFGFNLLPLPSNELTFALGIAKYNITRLFVFTLLGTIIKMLAIFGFYWISPFF